MTKNNPGKSKSGPASKNAGERELISIKGADDYWIINFPDKEDPAPVMPMPDQRNCLVRFFQFSEHAADDQMLNMKVRILALVRGGIRNMTVLATEKVIRIHPGTGNEVIQYEPIIIDQMAIGDAKDYDCPERIVSDWFRFPLANLHLRKFHIQARLTDCCGNVREILSPEFIYA